MVRIALTRNTKNPAIHDKGRRLCVHIHVQSESTCLQAMILCPEIASVVYSRRG